MGTGSLGARCYLLRLPRCGLDFGNRVTLSHTLPTYIGSSQGIIIAPAQFFVPMAARCTPRCPKDPDMPPPRPPLTFLSGRTTNLLFSSFTGIVTSILGTVVTTFQVGNVPESPTHY